MSLQLQITFLLKISSPHHDFLEFELMSLYCISFEQEIDLNILFYD